MKGKGAKLCLFDRDGVLNVDKAYLYRPGDAEWIPGSREAVAWLNRRGYTVVVVTNQSGVARGYYTEEDVHCFHRWMAGEFAKAGGRIDRFYYCPHLKEGTVAAYAVDCGCRKPKQVKELAEAVNVKLTPGEIRKLEEAAEQSGAKVLGHDLFRFAVLKKRK